MNGGSMSAKTSFLGRLLFGYLSTTLLVALPAHALILSSVGHAGGLPLPSTNSLDFNGTALSVTNRHIFQGAPDPLPSAIGGSATGKRGVGLSGTATGAS